MITVTSDLSIAIEHVKENCRITRLSRYLNNEGKPKHPMIIKVLTELTKEEVIQAIFDGYKIRE
ncbi:hypothetical protein ABE073_04885 [Lederbergia citrisecunda]|uniref:hypothetical protein n=1 Tax=Lederbergia citrisecunda TaxID=2833583 RepID=UPI003D2E4E29